MSDNIQVDEAGELSEQEKNEIYQNLLSGSGSGPLLPYIAKSRWICASIHPFLDLSRVFYAGLPEALRNEEDELDDIMYTDQEIEAFKSIMRLERGFRTIVSACTGDVRHLLALINKVSQAAWGLRSDDTTKLKSLILTYIHEDPKQGSIFAHDYDLQILIASDSKDLRGFRHIDTAAHLCPLRLKTDFENDPQNFMDRVEDGTVQITDEDFPSFLYEIETAYDEENEDIGLFRGFLLVRVYRHIFTGPSSAMNPTAKVNKSKARKFRLTEVTGRTIAYACVQAYIALSSMSQWASCDNLFNLQLFYDNIVDTFENNPQDPWVVETLEWWNEQVPGLRSRVSKHKKRTGPDVQNRTRPTPAERILAQRAQRAEIGAGNPDEDCHQRQQLRPGSVQQPRPAQQTSHPQADSNLVRVADLMSVNPPGGQQPLPVPSQHPLSLQAAHSAPRSTSTTGGDRYFLPGSSQQAPAAQQTQRAIQSPTGDDPEAPGMDAEEEEDRARRHVAQKATHFRPLSPRCLISTMKTNLLDSQSPVASKRRQQETDSELADENCEPLRKKRQTVASTAVKKSTVSTRKSKGKGKR